jgi:hypothetical protein
MNKPMLSIILSACVLVAFTVAVQAAGITQPRSSLLQRHTMKTLPAFALAATRICFNEN